MHDAGADLAAALQRVRNRLQESVATLHRQRPGGGHDGVELGIGQVNGRHGGLERLARWRARAQIWRRSWDLAPVHPGAFLFSRQAYAASSSIHVEVIVNLADARGRDPQRADTGTYEDDLAMRLALERGQDGRSRRQ
jgi:hypothetical protein